MKIKNLILLYIVSSSALMLAIPKIFIENRYKTTLGYTAPLVCKVNGQKEVRLENDYPVFLGYAQTMEGIIPGSISSLEIWATGYLSQPKSLQDYLKQISDESPAHPNQNAVIIIHPSSYYWNITVDWQGEKTVEAFRMKSPEEKFLNLASANDRLNAIISGGALGADISQKASAICRANYDVEPELRHVNLCENLKRNLVKPEYFVDPARKGIKPLPGPTIQEIKEMINRLYNNLQTYMKNGWAQ